MQNISIRTTQNVSIEYELASLRERILAYMLDFITYVFFVYMYFMAVVISFASSSFGDTNSMAGIFFTLLPVLGWIMYHFLMESFNKGRSLGKMALGIKVVRIDGKPVKMSDYLLRAVFQIIDSTLSFGVVGSVLIASSTRSQRFGDMAANTTVVRSNFKNSFKLHEILKIKTLENYEPKYTEVKQFSEKDMLLIRETIKRYTEFPNNAHSRAIIDLTNKVTDILGEEPKHKDRVAFLKNVIRDYIVLTR